MEPIFPGISREVTKVAFRQPGVLAMARIRCFGAAEAPEARGRAR